MLPSEARKQSCGVFMVGLLSQKLNGENKAERYHGEDRRMITTEKPWL